MYSTGPIRVFVQNAAYSALFWSFDKRNAIIRARFTIWRSARSDGKMFIFSSSIFGGKRCCKSSKSARGPAQCKFGPGDNMVSWCNHLLCHFSIKIHLHLASLYAKKYFWKKLDSRNTHWTNYWFWMEGAWAPAGCTRTHKLVIFTKKTKIFQGRFSSGLLFTAKILHQAMYLISFYRPNHRQNLTPKCKILKMFST